MAPRGSSLCFFPAFPARRCQEGLGLLLALKYMRCDVALRQGFAQLGAQKGAGRVTRDVRKIVGQKIPIHLGVSVVHFLVDSKAIVVDDGTDPFLGRAAALLADIPNRLHVLGDAHVHALEIEEEDVPLGIVARPFGQRQIEQFRLQVHRVGAEDAGVHDTVLADHRLEVHVRQDVPGDINAGGNLNQRQTAAHSAKHATLGDIVDWLTPVVRVLSVEGDLLDLFEELPLFSLFQDAELAFFHQHFEAGTGEGTDKHHKPRTLADVDKTARPGQAAAEPADVDVSRAITLGHTEASHVEAAAVVEVELLALVDHRIHVDAGPEVVAGGGDAADYAGLHRKGQQMRNVFFIGDGGHPLRHADTEVDDAVGRQLEGGASSDDLALIEGGRHQTGVRGAEFAGVGRVVLGNNRLPVLMRFGHDDAVHEDARDLHLPRRQRAALGDALHLGNDDTVAVLGRHRHGEVTEGERFALHGDIAEGVGGAAADEGDVDAADLVEQPLLAADFDEFDDVLGGGGIDPTTAVAWINEGVQADFGKGARLAPRKISEQLADDALRQIVGQDLVLQRETADLRHACPMTGHDAP